MKGNVRVESALLQTVVVQTEGTSDMCHMSRHLKEMKEWATLLCEGKAIEIA